MTKNCVICNTEFEPRRSDAKTCNDACRAKLSRRKRDPQIGSFERRQNQRAGLDAKYTYRQRGQAREALQKLGLAPTESDGDEPIAFHKAAHDPILWHARGKAARRVREIANPGRWSPADGWWRNDTMLSVGTAPTGDVFWTSKTAIALEQIDPHLWHFVFAWAKHGQVEMSRLPGGVRWAMAPDGSVWPVADCSHVLMGLGKVRRRLGVSPEDIERRLEDGIKAVTQPKETTMLSVPTDEETAEILLSISGNAQRIVADAARLQRKYPTSSILQDTVDAFIHEALAASE
jgi:hypothetical protein